MNYGRERESEREREREREREGERSKIHRIKLGGTFEIFLNKKICIQFILILSFAMVHSYFSPIRRKIFEFGWRKKLGFHIVPCIS